MIPKKFLIQNISGREVLDSRGFPTLEVEVCLGSGVVARAGVPAGTSTGSHEALELRDGEVGRFKGKGVLKAVRNVEKVNKVLMSKDVRGQEGIDASLLVADGTEQKANLGANTMLGVSLACARAAAVAEGLQLYEYLGHLYREEELGRKVESAKHAPYRSGASGAGSRVKSRGWKLPMPMFNILNGGAHADNGLDVQEIMVVPVGFASARKQVQVGTEVFHTLGTVLTEHHLATAVGLEGGYAPAIDSVTKAFDLVMSGIERAGFKPGRDVALALDVAASGFYDERHHHYRFRMDENWFDADQLISLYHDWVRTYPIMSIEDPLSEDDFEHLSKLTHEFSTLLEISKLGKRLLTRTRAPRFKLMIVGDDHYTTNVGRIERAVIMGAGNAAIVKPNQAGTLTETLACIHLLEKNRWPRIISHRSGETNDDFIVDLAVGIGAEYLKAGAPSRGERVAKYNRLMEIEELLGR